MFGPSEIDVTSIIDILFNLAGVVLMAVATWAANMIRTKFKVDIDVERGGILQNAIEKGLSRARSFVVGADGVVSFQVQNAMVGMAAEYVIGKVPETLAHFGITREGLQQMIEARLGGNDAPQPEQVVEKTSFNYPLPPQPAKGSDPAQ